MPHPNQHEHAPIDTMTPATADTALSIVIAARTSLGAVRSRGPL